MHSNDAFKCSDGGISNIPFLFITYYVFLFVIDMQDVSRICNKFTNVPNLMDILHGEHNSIISKEKCYRSRFSFQIIINH